MSYTVYGIRIRGERETRYIGQTSGDPKTRLTALRCDAGAAFLHWLDANRGRLEAFSIARFTTREEAKATEAVVINLCLRLNHRLFNRDHVPAHLRANEIELAA
jgi:hypothetical protein